MSLLKFIRDAEFDLKVRALECEARGNHSPMAPLRLRGLTFTQLVECAHCGERALVETNQLPASSNEKD